MTDAAELTALVHQVRALGCRPLDRFQADLLAEAFGAVLGAGALLELETDEDGASAHLYVAGAKSQASGGTPAEAILRAVVELGKQS